MSNDFGRVFCPPAARLADFLLLLSPIRRDGLSLAYNKRWLYAKFYLTFGSNFFRLNCHLIFIEDSVQLILIFIQILLNVE